MTYTTPITPAPDNYPHQQLNASYANTRATHTAECFIDSRELTPIEIEKDAVARFNGS